MFDPTRKSTKTRADKTKTQAKAKKQLTAVSKPYRIVKDLQDFKIYEADEDFLAALEKTNSIVVQRHEINYFADFPRYLDASDEEVNQLWNFSHNGQEQQNGQAGSVADQLKYEMLLQTLFKSLSASAQVVELPPLSYQKQGSLRVKINNFKEICDSFNRDTDSVAKYISSQFAADAAVTEGVLSIKKSLPKDQILSAILQYRKQYVQCSSCGSMNTMIVRNTSSKDQILSCDDCLAQRHIK